MTASLPLAGTRLADLETELAAATRGEAVGEIATARSLDRLARRYRALADVMAPDGAFAARLSSAFVAEMKTSFEGNLPEAARIDVARTMVQSILDNRRRDALATAAQIDDPEWRQTAVAAHGVLATTPVPTGLSEQKLHEMRDHLFGANPTAPEPAVHIELNALGQQIGHKALARLFDPQQGEGARLTADLAALCPEDSPEALAGFAERWLGLRSQRAAWSAEALALDSAFMKETIHEAERRRAAPTPSANDNLPPVETIAAAQPVEAPPTTRIAADQLLDSPSLLGNLGQTLRSLIGR